MKIVALSDQHGTFPVVPKCDLLIVAGDNCPDRFGWETARVNATPQFQWFNWEWMNWRRSQPATHCVLTWGNHDYCGHSINRASSIVDLGDRTTVVVDDLVEIDGVRIWLTPWSVRFRDWAFMGDESRLGEFYNRIPDGIDILVSHQPMKNVLDGGNIPIIGGGSESLGSMALRDAVHRVRPKVLIHGHVHRAHGHVLYSVMPMDGAPPSDAIRVYNVAVLDDNYKTAWEPTVIEL